MQFIVVVDGKIVGQIHWDGLSELDLPMGAVIMSIAQAVDLGLAIQG
jgi:hypothetical protein